MKYLILKLLLVCLLTAGATAGELILKSDSLGPLKLDRDTRVSLKKLAELFPEYKVTHEIAQGDSPDFHYFEVTDKNGETIFYISSYIDENTQRNAKDVDIDLLVIESPSIKDQYGIHPGMYYTDIIQRRNEKLEFGANHHDYHLGTGKIWYALSSVDIYNKFTNLGTDEIKLDNIKSVNPKIIELSWPIPRW